MAFMSTNYVWLAYAGAAALALLAVLFLQRKWLAALCSPHKSKRPPAVCVCVCCAVLLAFSSEC